MHVSDIHNELSSYYTDTYAVYDGMLYLVREILSPEPTGYDDYDEPEWDLPSNADVDNSLEYFEAYCEPVVLHDEPDCATIPMDELSFIFPEAKLVNVPIKFGDVTFNMAKYVARRADRQWKRGLRHSMLSACIVPFRARHFIKSVTGQSHIEFQVEVTNLNILNTFFPEYYSVTDALQYLNNSIGSCAVSEDWWIGQGNESLVFGYQLHTVGTITEDGVFELHDGCKYLSESLTETLGDNYAVR